MELKITNIIDISKCWHYLRQVRWVSGVNCCHCGSSEVKKNGQINHNQGYLCKTCGRKFNDLTGTIFSHSNVGLEIWMLTLYFMGLNLSNSQIAKELDISEVTAQSLTTKLREGIVKKKLIWFLKEQLRLTKFM